ncbi:MAG: hypothetical protein ACFB0E_22295 [Leptolyngbyaceae cyanobacterium]
MLELAASFGYGAIALRQIPKFAEGEQVMAIVQAYRAHLKSSDSCATMKEDAKAKENELLKQFDQ